MSYGYLVKEMEVLRTQSPEELERRRRLCLDRADSYSADEYETGAVALLSLLLERTEARLQASEAGAAALREALEWAGKELISDGWMCDGSGDEIEQALASEAGKELMARLEKLEQEREASCGYKHGWVPVTDETMRTAAWARRGALEEAAKVAERQIHPAMDGGCCVPLCQEVAAAIRALKQEPK